MVNVDRRSQRRRNRSSGPHIAAEPDPLEVVTTGDPEARELAQLTERNRTWAQSFLAT